MEYEKSREDFDKKMENKSVKIEISEDVADRSPSTSAKINTDENIANEPVIIQESIDTTDKKGQNNTAKQTNNFAAKKTVAQGMMDVALMTANANQLRYLIEYQRNSPTFYLVMILIIISLLLQIAVGISLIFKGRLDIKGKSKSLGVQKINNYVVVGVFLITITNVFIAAFSVSVPDVQPLPVTASTNGI